MAVDILWSKRAKKSFDNIADFIEENWSEKAAWDNRRNPDNFKI